MAKYSRRATLEEKKNKRKAVIFVALTIVMVLVLFFYGIPLLIKYTGFLTDIRKSSTPIETEDTTPPPPPRVDDLPESTKDFTVDVNGSTEEGATVIMIINGIKEEVLANKNGRFSKTIELLDGENTVVVYAKDSSGNESKRTDEFVILYDNEPPELEIISPEDGHQTYGSSGRQISIEGSTDDNADVTINGRFVVVDKSGKFSFTTTLSEGENEFIIKAEDEANNAIEKTIKVKYNP